jgi:hypothetical protein
MDNVNQVGKKLGKTKKEAQLNIRRSAENFPTPERAIQNFNPLFNYNKSFVTSPDAHVLIDVQLKDIITPCSINPPTSGIWCRAQFGLISYPDAGGRTEVLHLTTSLSYPVTMLDNNGKVDPVTEEETLFILNGDGSITVPEDGCYGVTWSSGAWGVSYFSTHNQHANFYHNGNLVKSVAKPTTGIIHVLGPLIWQYPAITYFYQVIEAKAGDTILVTLTDDGMNECYSWWGCLRGFFVWQETTQIRIDCIAIAENV